MELTPQTVRSTTFSTARKGYDQDEVEAFKEQAAAAIEAAQNQSAAMEARARAAVARLQELTATDSAPSVEPTTQPASPSPADAEIISRTLMLAQRTADATVADAERHAEQVRSDADVESAAMLENARLMSGRLLDEARVEARRGLEDERMNAENEVQALMARRDFLVADVDQLEIYVGSQRERLRDAAVQLLDMVDRVPGGLAEMRRPLLSAAGDTVAPVEPASSFDEPTDDHTDDHADDDTDDDTDEVPVVVSAGEGDDDR